MRRSRAIVYETTDQRLEAGSQALAVGAWEEARSHFETALTEAETPEALEGLAEAAWWLDDVAIVFDARERAYRLFRRDGDSQGAAGVACHLAVDYLVFRGEDAVCQGWFARAHRLLEDEEPGPVHAMLAAYEGLVAMLVESDPEKTRRLAASAYSLARSLGFVDVEMFALGLEGLALVSEGDIEAGMRRLDEATAAATAGEMSDIGLVGLTCCFLIYACERVRDYDRAAQWCERVQAYCLRWGMRFLFAVCRTHHAMVLMFRGEWERAEAELLEANEQLNARPGQGVDGLARLGELRRRQGRLEEAEELLTEVDVFPEAQLSLAALGLDRQDPTSAADWVERFLRHMPSENIGERAGGLELLVRARAGLGERRAARAALADLEEIAKRVGGELLRASARFAQGVMLSAEGDHDAARRSLQDAVDLYRRSRVPHEAARARLELARSLLAAGRIEQAVKEARSASDTFEDLGASLDLQRANRILDEAGREGDPAASPSASGSNALTPRERDVLLLLAEGLSNPEIALRLVVSEHTVHRHVANVLTKLDVSSRAAAVAQATRRGFV